MTDPVLKVTNISQAEVSLARSDGTTVKIAANATVDLTRPLIASEGFAAEFRAGHLKIEAPDPAKPEDVELGVFAARHLLGVMSQDLTGAADQMKSMKEGLARQRDAYNLTHKSTAKVITDGKKLEAGAQQLLDALGRLLVPAAEIKALDDAEKDLAKLDADFIQAGVPTAASLDAYLTARALKVTAVADAKKARDAATLSLAGDQAPKRTQIEQAKSTIVAITTQQIGNEIAWP